ncbi:2-amino-4-hydroxy-6-hydroxymethyldihydropteridine diphosphokinase [bacterium]|nr:2-amino-4-hydroxy-6-hydroxymethyldihydropteridine diphosphokinase [bacterium]
MRALNTVFIGVGSNMKNPLKNCVTAVQLLTKCKSIKCLAYSRWYLTQPFGDIRQSWFVNGVIQLKTTIEPESLLTHCQAIEEKLNRKRTVHWGPRTIDLDVLLWEDHVCYSKFLILPHPGLHLRRFVLKPFCDLEPTAKHPLLGKTIKTLLESLSDSLEVRPLN